MNALLSTAGGKLPASQSEAVRIRYQAFARSAMPAFPPRESNRVRIISRGGRTRWMNSKT